MELRNISKVLLPVVCAAGGFFAGYFYHQKKTANHEAEALKKQADMYNEQIKKAHDLFQSVTYKEALEKLDKLRKEDAEKQMDVWYHALSPGIYTVDEYNSMFKPAPTEALVDELPEYTAEEAKEKHLIQLGDVWIEDPAKCKGQLYEKKPVARVKQNDISGKEDTAVRYNVKTGMDWHGDPVGYDDEGFETEDDDIEYSSNDAPLQEIMYIRPEDVGMAYGYTESCLKIFDDGIVTDDAMNLVPLDEAKDLLGDDYGSHMSEYGDEAMWVMNNRNHTYYEVLYDPRTYREAIGRE